MIRCSNSRAAASRRFLWLLLPGLCFAFMPPPLPPTPVGVAAPNPSLKTPKVVVEAFLDLNCPFSKKLFKAVYEGGVLEEYKDKSFQFIFQNVIQPWHPTGALMHEAHLAVHAVKPDAFYPFANVVFDHIQDFSDQNTYNKTRAQITQELISLAEQLGVDRSALLDKLTTRGEGNAGNAVTQTLKWSTKYHRTRSVHVTPTVFVNGQEAVEVSSGWDKDQWREFIEKMLAA